MKASDLQVGIGVDLSELTNGLKKVSSQLDSFSKNTSNDAKQVGDSWTNNLGGIVKGFISLELASRGLSAIKNVFLLEERFNALKMPLKNVTEATGDYGVALTFITKLADQTGQDLFVLGDSYKGLYASAKQAGIATTEIHNIFGAIVRSGSALKLSNEQVALSLKAVEQMMNKGTISSEELKGQLGEQLPGAYAMMAKAAKDAGLSVSGSTQELGKLLDEGKVASAQVLPFFAKRMEEAFGKNADANINTISGSANRLNNELAQLVSALDESKVTSFWASIQNGIADVMKDLTFMVKSGSFRDFLSYMTGQGFKTTGMRLAQESNDANFASKNPKEQAKIYRDLNLQLQENIKNSRDLIKAGITPNTEALSKLADQVKRYKGLMSGTGGGGGKTPPLIPPTEAKAIQDYTFDIALLNLEIKNGLANIKQYNDALSLAGMRKINFTPQAMSFTMSRTEDMAKGDKGLINQLFGEDLNKSTANLQAKFETLKSGIKPLITKFGVEVSEDVNVAMGYVNTAFNQSFSFLGDVISTGFASIFNKDIKFDFKKMLGNFLSGLGEVVMTMALQMKAIAALKTKVELALTTFGGGSFALAGAIGLFALGAAIKGGGMAMSNSASSSMGSATTTNARNTSPYVGAYGMAGNVKFEVEGTKLVGVLNNTNQSYGG